MDELWRRTKAHTSKRSRGPRWQPKSTKIGIWDIAILAEIRQGHLYDWLYGIRKFGPVRQRRLSRMIRLIDGGYVQKTQYGKYIIHETPFAPPVKRMQVNIGVDGPQLKMVAPLAPPTGMPSFNKLFGRK